MNLSTPEFASSTEPIIEPRPDPDPDPLKGGRRILRWALNAWLVFHLSAIIIAPSSIAPTSELMASSWQVVRPYLQILYLNHGYHFFAPEPAESTLLSYTVHRDDGTVVQGRIPNFEIQPRLLYHRHFMLTEHMIQVPDDVQKQWLQSFATHLGHKHGGKRVSLARQTHNLPSMEMVRDGAKLTDISSYEEQPLGDFRCDER